MKDLRRRIDDHFIVSEAIRLKRGKEHILLVCIQSLGRQNSFRSGVKDTEFLAKEDHII
jgi:hypothetical protein